MQKRESRPSACDLAEPRENILGNSESFSGIKEFRKRLINYQDRRIFDADLAFPSAQTRSIMIAGAIPPAAHSGEAAARDVTADRLDLQNVGALVRQKHGRERSRDDAGQIEHANTAEWAGHDILP